MDRTTIRDRLTTTLNTWWGSNHSTVPLFFENAEPINEDSLPDVAAICVVDFAGAEQINVSPTPDTRFYGDLNIVVITRETLGVRALLVLADSITSYFGYADVSNIHLGVPRVDPEKAPPGWFGKMVSIPFYADSNAA